MGRSISTVPADSRVSVPVTTNHTVSSGEILLIDTSGGTELTLTLPASPRQGDRVNLIDVAGITELSDGLSQELGNLEAIFSTNDALEGLSALIEGRKPTYQNS